MELQQSVLELIAGVSALSEKVSSMEPNIEKLLESKLEIMSNQITNIEKILTIRVENIEKKICSTQENADILSSKLTEHDKIISGAKTYIEKIISLENRVDNIENQIVELKNEPMKKDSTLISDLKNAIKNAIFVAIGAGVVSFFVFLYNLYKG
jgi:chromosome segregation ATPase